MKGLYDAYCRRHHIIITNPTIIMVMAMVIITTAIIIIIIMLEEALEGERVLPWARFNLAAKSLVPLHIHPHTQLFHHIVITISSYHHRRLQ